jgi:nitrous oxidase accessory protein NosD
MNRMHATAALLLAGAALPAQDLAVKPGDPLQKAIDAAPAGATLALAEGAFHERVVITKPLTLRGAGWDKTVLVPTAAEPTDREPTVTIRAAAGVTLRGLRIGGPAPKSVEGLNDAALVRCEGSSVVVEDCAVLGPFMCGVVVAAGSDAQVRRTLVAGLWNIGVSCSGSSPAGKPSRLSLVESDVRNCYHRCVTLGVEGCVVDKCRISGSAWHGIRYGGSQTITSCWIFGNARSGIYADGPSQAVVRGNVFWRNEMNGVSCWSMNTDQIERNTFVGNLREAIVVLADSKPSIVENVFVEHPLAISCSRARTGDLVSELGKTLLAGNVFWKNRRLIDSGGADQPLLEGGRVAEVRFRDAARFDFTLAGEAKVGAPAPIPLRSPWPVQPEELQIVPDGDLRGFQGWKKPK